jgi:hypothetical protein
VEINRIHRPSFIVDYSPVIAVAAPFRNDK